GPRNREVGEQARRTRRCAQGRGDRARWVIHPPHVGPPRRHRPRRLRRAGSHHMPFRVELPQTFSGRVAGLGNGEYLAGMWVCSASPVAAEIAAASGMQWVLIDADHSPIGLETTTSLLRAMNGYPATPVVRVPVNDRVLIKQYLDLGAQNLLVPMVDTEADAEAAVAAVRYPPRGVRGVGSALARASRWNAVDGYLSRAEELLSLTVQIESATAVDNAAAIAAVDGIDQVFVGPSDLAASMGLLGQQTHPEVTDAV